MKSNQKPLNVFVFLQETQCYFYLDHYGIERYKTGMTICHLLDCCKFGDKIPPGLRSSTLLDLKTSSMLPSLVVCEGQSHLLSSWECLGVLLSYVSSESEVQFWMNPPNFSYLIIVLYTDSILMLLNLSPSAHRLGRWGGFTYLHGLESSLALYVLYIAFIPFFWLLQNRIFGKTLFLSLLFFLPFESRPNELS